MLTGMPKAAKNYQKSKNLLPKFQKLLSKFLDISFFFFGNISVNFKKALFSVLTIVVSISQEK